MSENIQLSENEWDRFFTTLERIVHAPTMTWMEKRDEIMLEAQERGCETALSEFVDWLSGPPQSLQLPLPNSAPIHLG